MQRERTYFYEVTLQLDCGEAVVEVSLPDGVSEDAIYSAAVTELVSQCSYAKLGSVRKGGWTESFKEEPEQPRCIWPDCGHDTNRIGYGTSGCDGVGCPKGDSNET